MTLALQAYAKLSFSEVSFPPLADVRKVRSAATDPNVRILAGSQWR
jgi:hypothetical protein